MKEELIKMLKELENYGDVDFEDYSIDDEEDKEIHIEFNDFEGFEEDGEEIDRDYEAKFWGSAKEDFAKWYLENKYNKE